jgi:hypothetical protein
MGALKPRSPFAENGSMAIAILVGIGTLFTVWIITGVRLMLLARRTRALPEFILGLALLTIAGIGFPLSALGPFVGDWQLAFTFGGSAFSNTGTCLLMVFTARVFHDGSRLAWSAVGAAAALLTVQAFGHTLGQAFAETPAEKLEAILFWSAGSFALSAVAWGWVGFEALRYHALLRRRVVLGLADPVVANRMLLWGLMGTIATTCVLVDAALMYAGGEVGRQVLLPLVTCIAGLLSSACTILAFWPPAAYLALVRGSAART